LVLLGATAAAAPPPPDASRAELSRWLVELRDAGRAVAAPQRWQYSFVAADGRALERLSVALVGAGYEIVALTAAGPSAELRVARSELHTPRTLERRNGELEALARAQGVRYLGIALP
jgi:hypothetical protein